jgi:hypothetical protein
MSGAPNVWPRPGRPVTTGDLAARPASTRVPNGSPTPARVPRAADRRSGEAPVSHQLCSTKSAAATAAALQPHKELGSCVA